MQLVQQANQSPHHCAVIPFKGNSNARGGFIDTGQHLGFENEHKVYICLEAAIEIAKLIGWAPPSLIRGAQAESAAKDARIEQLEAELAEERKFGEAAEFSLNRLGQKVKQKPGPKGPRKREVAA